MNISDHIQAFELALYVTGKADLLMFLKHLGFNDFQSQEAETYGNL